MAKFKVVFHLDEEDKTNLVLNNIKNLIADMGKENLGIEMVANSKAVKSLVKGNEFEPFFNKLASEEVQFCACANALRDSGIQKDELFDFVTVVSAGIGELIKKQAAGWAYIRP